MNSSMLLSPLQIASGLEITTQQEAFLSLKEVISKEVEEVWVLALSSSKGLIGRSLVFRGTVDFCLFHPRDIFRFAIASNASGIIVAHNHPLGQPIPSYQDIVITRKLMRAGALLDIEVLDHLILSPLGFASVLDSIQKSVLRSSAARKRRAPHGRPIPHK